MTPPTRSKLPLKGSAKVITDYFLFSLHSILYQRGIYPSDEFRMVKKWGLTLVQSIDPEVEDYLNRIMDQLKKWVYSGKIKRVVIAIIKKEIEVQNDESEVEVEIEIQKVVEKWEFTLDLIEEDHLLPSEIELSEETQRKNFRDIQKMIQSIIRQITASITFLPLLEGPHTFNVLVFADENTHVPQDWGYAEPQKVYLEGEKVKFRDLKTARHEVGTSVTYTLNE